MKRAWIILLGGLLLGAAAFACVYFTGTMQERSVSQKPEPALAWLQREFELSDSDFQKLVELHDAYRPRCAEMCRRIDQKNQELAQLLKSTDSVTPEIRKVLSEAAELRAECQANMLAHFYAVAKSMPPEQGQRYLEWIKQETFQPSNMPMHAQPQDSHSAHHM
jgi:hypothetical protein